MNKTKLSVVALLLTSTFALAGGKMVAPPEDTVIDIPKVELSGFYAGLGYSCLQMDFDRPHIDVRSMTAISATAGYNINKYLAVEGRYTVSLGDLDFETHHSDTEEEGDMSNIALYLKPKYSVNSFTVYGLVGYGQLTLDDGDEEYSEAGFQYGAGISAMATDNIEVYVDYRRLYNDEAFDGASLNKDVTGNSFTAGVNYHF